MIFLWSLWYISPLFKKSNYYAKYTLWNRGLSNLLTPTRYTACGVRGNSFAHYANWAGRIDILIWFKEHDPEQLLEKDRIREPVALIGNNKDATLKMKNPESLWRWISLVKNILNNSEKEENELANQSTVNGV